VAVLEVVAVGGDHRSRQHHELGAAAAGRARALGDLDQLADDVTPAQLLLKDVQEVIVGVATDTTNPPKSSPSNSVAAAWLWEGSIR